MSRPPSTEAIQRGVTRLVSGLFGGKASVRVSLERDPNGAQRIRIAWQDANGWDGVVTLGRRAVRELTAKELAGVMAFIDHQIEPLPDDDEPDELGEPFGAALKANRKATRRHG